MKNLLTLAFIIFSGLNVFGQEEPAVEYPIKGHTQFGVSIGSYGSMFSENGWDPIEDTEAVYNFGFNVNYEYFLSKNWGLKAGLTFDPKGSKDEGGASEVKMQYVTLSTLASWHFGKRRRWYLHFGPYFGLLNSAKTGGASVKTLFNSFDSGLDIGIGIKIPVAGLNFYIETDGQTSFSSPLKVDINNDASIARNTLSLGILF